MSLCLPLRIQRIQLPCLDPPLYRRLSLSAMMTRATKWKIKTTTLHVMTLTPGRRNRNLNLRWDPIQTWMIKIERGKKRRWVRFPSMKVGTKSTTPKKGIPKLQPQRARHAQPRNRSPRSRPGLNLRSKTKLKPHTRKIQLQRHPKRELNNPLSRPPIRLLPNHPQLHPHPPPQPQTQTLTQI